MCLVFFLDIQDWIISSKNADPLRTSECDLIWKKRFFWCNYLRFWRGAYPGFRVRLTSNDWCPYKKGRSTEARRKMETNGKTKVMCPWRQILDWSPRIAWGSETPEESRKNPSLEMSAEAWSCWHPNFRFLASRTLREYISVALSHQGWG